jgi:tetratricopeptide (TPR) repeat protein
MAEAKTLEEFISQQRTALASNPECGTTHYNLGVALLSQKKISEAEKEFFDAIECSPGLAEAYVQLGGICFQRGDLDGCLDFNTRAVKARPGFSEGHGNIGFVHLQKGNVDEAIVALERATTFNFRFIQALTTLANAYLMKGRVEDSINTNLKALEIEPEFPVAHNNLAIAYLERGEYELAARHCDKAVSLGYGVAEEVRREIEEKQADQRLKDEG